MGAPRSRGFQPFNAAFLCCPTTTAVPQQQQEGGSSEDGRNNPSLFLLIQFQPIRSRKMATWWVTDSGLTQTSRIMRIRRMTDGRSRLISPVCLSPVWWSTCVTRRHSPSTYSYTFHLFFVGLTHHISLCRERDRSHVESYYIHTYIHTYTHINTR